jgi:hypothetical protein
MNSVVGLAPFGLQDALWVEEQGLYEEKFSIYDVLLPREIVGEIRTGEDALEDRLHTGLSWPLDARLEKKLRRVPVPVIWKAMVEAGDRLPFWSSPGGFSWSLGKLLTNHIKYLLNKYICNSAKINPVVTIADNFDEMAQDSVLREIELLGLPEPFLIWRPVAVALAWLDQVGHQLSGFNFTKENYIHVIYFGADALEFTTLRLAKERHSNGLDYIVPVRDRPKLQPEFSGLDWVGQIMEQCCQEDTGAFWQLMTTFPDIWELVAGRSFTNLNNPKPWSFKDGWKLWDPGELKIDPLTVKIKQCKKLLNILNESCPLSNVNRPNTINFTQWLWEKLESIKVTSFSGQLLGLICCGPLLSPQSLSWLGDIRNIFGQNWINGGLDSPKPKQLWLSPGHTSIAYGAQLYGRRLLNGEPTYFDTLPQLSLLTKHGSGLLKWSPLIDQNVVEGGQAYINSINNQFKLNMDSSKLDIYLYKGINSNIEQVKYTTATSTTTTSSTNVTTNESNYDPSAKARLIRAWVRRKTCVENVKQSLPSLWSLDDKKYALRFAEDVLKQSVSDNESERESENETEVSVRPDTPYRQANIYFPSKPDQDVPLEVRVFMKPAAGLAKVTFSPEDLRVFNWREVALNFSTMRLIDNPNVKMISRGWPKLNEILIDPTSNEIVKNEKKIKQFETFLPVNNNIKNNDAYKKVLDTICKLFSTSAKKVYDINQLKIVKSQKHSDKDSPDNEFVVFQISEQGKTGDTGIGQSYLDRIRKKINTDCKVFKEHKNNDLLRDLASKSANLFLAAPDEIIDYVRDKLQNNNKLLSQSKKTWNILIIVASKIFDSQEDIKKLFIAINHRIETFENQPLSLRFPIYSQQAICNLLMYRQNTVNLLNDSYVKIFISLCLDRMLEESSKNNYSNIFYQSILLLTYLLRYRIINDELIDSKLDNKNFWHYNPIDIINKSIKYFENINNIDKMNKSREVLECFEGYIKYTAISDLPVAIISASNINEDDISVSNINEDEQ